MKYSRVYVESVGYELAPIVVTSTELESRLQPTYEALHIAPGQLEALTGIRERRWWKPNTPISHGAIAAAKKSLQERNISPEDIGAVVYAGVCREHFEPATACQVAAALGVKGNAAVYDLSNACLGVLNGVLDIANRIELGQIRAGLVVACESSREINEIMIKQMNSHPSMELFTKSLATMTGGSGAAAVLLTDGSFTPSRRPKLLGGVNVAEPEFHELCRWGIRVDSPENHIPYMSTDAVAVMKHGVELGKRTWDAFASELDISPDKVDKVICHQVGEAHQKLILQTIGISPQKDFTTFEFLGNMGTVSLPITAAIAKERDVLLPGDFVGFLGIGSGLNCLMMGIQW
ncbi:3-oxoacyl-[acyl-carrier-protein] synthase-3 [Malonomonas rubra DSM 5091]|uniref:3-oxoacyl-[acyl-carrier-protein] synthase-3 n=1 Tax=Malonomonas rubra DSM 5091 TaxID=1122189 RepID=A0A1M6LIB2_MALRU|nr:3-oxoacyl-ACP synthase III [Malonomonas rubra]SHJ70924.1 3-oxoacyl-[acyl-carrier-protein] synthase-3 [Malonomonas rubra DSM 5091]